jgi:hypothetical protein
MFDWYLENITYPCTFSVTDGELPPGLELSTLPGQGGMVRGTPTELGEYDFTLRATNVVDFDEKEFSIEVIQGPVSGGGTGYVGGN